MVNNYWLDRAMAVCENELILVKASPNTQDWFDKMPKQIPAIYPEIQLTDPEDFAPKVGYAHHMRMTRFGIEGVLKLPKKLHKLQFHVLYAKWLRPYDPFWVVLY